MASRSYCWTLFGYTIADEMHILNIDCRYIIFGREICTTTGRQHLQGYIEFSKPRRLNNVKALFNNDKVHLETRHGTRDDARDYCRKGIQSHEEWTDLKSKGPNWGLEASCEEAGSWESGGQGRRTDLDSVAQRILAGATKSQILEESPVSFIKHHRGIEAAIALRERETTKSFREIHTTVLWGDSGVGKTRAAHDADPNIFTVNPEDTFPFDGYDGEKSILIDDFYGTLKYGFLLRVLDGHQLRLNVKGGHRYAAWTKVYITSNEAPDQWYKRGLTPALSRRLTTVTQLRNEVGGNTNPHPGVVLPHHPSLVTFTLANEDIEYILADFEN